MTNLKGIRSYVKPLGQLLHSSPDETGTHIYCRDQLSQKQEYYRKDNLRFDDVDRSEQP